MAASWETSWRTNFLTQLQGAGGFPAPYAISPTNIFVAIDRLSFGRVAQAGTTAGLLDVQFGATRALTWSAGPVPPQGVPLTGEQDAYLYIAQAVTRNADAMAIQSQIRSQYGNWRNFPGSYVGVGTVNTRVETALYDISEDASPSVRHNRLIVKFHMIIKFNGW
jgi:hypothetical protein